MLALDDYYEINSSIQTQYDVSKNIADKLYHHLYTWNCDTYSYKGVYFYRQGNRHNADRNIYRNIKKIMSNEKGA